MEIYKDLVAASSLPLIISILKSGDSYGYDIIQKIKRVSDNEIEWTDGMLYPVLHKLEKRELIESYWVKSESGRKRKYYRVKDEGIKELTKQQKQWDFLYKIITKLKEDELCLN